MIFWYLNLFDTGGIRNVSSEDVEFPVENMQNPLVTKVWKTGATLTDEYFDVDLGSAKDVSSVVLFNHDLTASDSLIEVWFDDNPSFATPLTITLPWNAGPISKSFTTQSYRYVRIRFTKSAADEIRSIGRVFLGVPFATTRKPAYGGGMLFNPVDESLTTRTLGGQEYTLVRPQHDEPDIRLNHVEPAEMQSIVDMYEYVGSHTPFFMQINPDQAGKDEIYYVRFKALPTKEWTAFPNRFSTQLSFMEQV